MSAAPEEEKKDEEEGASKPKSGGSKLPLIVAVVNTVGLLGLAGFVVLSKGKDDTKDAAKGKDPHAVASHAAEEHGAAAEEAGGEHEGGEEHGKEGEGHKAATQIVSVGTLVINLKDPGGERYLKAKFGMEIEGEGEIKKEAEGKVSKVRYELLMILSDLRVVDVTGPEKIEALKKVMLQKAKRALAPEIKVVGIYPEDWVIQ